MLYVTHLDESRPFECWQNVLYEIDFAITHRTNIWIVNHFYLNSRDLEGETFSIGVLGIISKCVVCQKPHYSVFPTRIRFETKVIT